MPEVRILAERVSHGGRNLVRGDALSGQAKNLQPLVDSKAAEWTDPPPGIDIDVDAYALGSMDVPEAKALIKATGDPVTLRDWLTSEQRHPRYAPNGRKGVRDSIEKRLLELEEAHDGD